MDPKVSVIIPVYNTVKYLQQCIDSLLAQTLSELELIFVDDRSSDDSLQILRENESRHPERIRVIESPENRCQGGARNLGLLAAAGEYVIFCDSDDLVAPEMYELLYRAVTENRVEAAFCDLASVPENVTMEDAQKLAEAAADTVWEKRLEELSDHSLSTDERRELLIAPMGGTVTWMLRRDMLLEQDLLFPEKVKYEDNYWGSLVRASLHSVHYVRRVCYYYRRHGESTTCSRNNPGVYDRITLENRLLEEYRRRGLYDALLPAAEYLYTTRYALMTYGFFLYTYDDPPVSVMKGIFSELKKNFPDWRKNPYYIREVSRKEKLLNECKVRFPGLYCRLRGKPQRG